MINISLRFRLPNGLGSLVLSPTVLTHFEAHKQLKCLASEAGGQLFATFENWSIMNIVDVTGPRPTDKRSMFRYQPDRIAENAEIREQFARGLHFVGDWHTHKQRVPMPSSTDENSIRELVQRSSYDLAGFVLVVVGQTEFPNGLHVSFHTKTGSTILRANTNDESI